MKKDESSVYQAYLLRCWQEAGMDWRFRLQDVETGEQIGFTDLEAMLEFLREVIENGGQQSVEAHEAVGSRKIREKNKSGRQNDRGYTA